MTEPAHLDTAYELDDRYRRASGRVYLSGVQALVRLPLMQRQRDRAAGLDTAGFISGYRGSPLGTYDMALWQARAHLEAHGIRFEPGVNEDLAATAVWGSQQAQLYPNPKHEGVFGIWYGKGPGVDRSCDALKHGNYAGAAAKGGVLVLAGDDPGAKSSSIAHQSEHALIHCGIPILNPSSVQDYLDFGLAGWAISRFSGSWVGMKCLTDTVESAASVEVDPGRLQLTAPRDFTPPEAGLHIGWTNYPIPVEQRLYHQRLPAVEAFVRANGLDRVALDAPRRRIGIVTTGKAYLDVRQALDELGIDDERAAEAGLCIYKVAMTWPLEPQGALAFADGLDDLLVVEEKRPLLEEQLARLIVNQERRPRLVGKRDLAGAPLVPDVGELSPTAAAEAVRRFIQQASPELAATLRPAPTLSAPAPGGLMRLPAFCSGCPHNTSTRVPEGSVAQGGIGCHGMAVWLPDRPTLAVTQMGGEGANWIGSAPFTETPHIFQNIGDGTYFHSGLLAIRAAVTANVDITYKVLANGAVAMTGGQPIEGEPMEGEVTVPEIVAQLAAEGVKRIAVVADDPTRHRAGFGAGVTVHHRDELDAVQQELRGVRGVTALVYDQTCAAEARRLRKRDAFPDPDQRVVINELVCEGCGDCSVQSNCIAIEPIETEHGRKRRINQSSCNKDFSCLKGYCPSFVTVHGGRLRQSGGGEGDVGDSEHFGALPLPAPPDTGEPFNALVAGIGGTGVITVGAILGMAAHLEGKGCSVLDVTGLAQKNGPVTSHVRIADDPERIHSTRIASGGADLILGCDLIVASGMDALSKMAPGRTTVVMNDHVAPTSDFATNPDLDLSPEGMENAVRGAAGPDDAHFLPATRIATVLMGDAIATNPFLMGFAFQRGRLPVSLAALERAFELNGRAVAWNLRAFAWGRLYAHDREAVDAVVRPRLGGADIASEEETLEQMVARRAAFLTAYQNREYADAYRTVVERVAAREREIVPGSDALARAVARYAFKLRAVKDEYEVARLYTDGSFAAQVEREFEGDYTLQYHLAPPYLPVLDRFLDRTDERTGRTKKIVSRFWIHGFRLLAAMKPLRGTVFDVFNRTPHRRLEFGLIPEYEQGLEELLTALSPANHAIAVDIARIPEEIRGFDTVKEEHLERARSKRDELLAAFRLHTGSEATG